MRRAVCSGGAWGVLCLVGCVVGVWAQGDSQWRAKNDHGSRYEGLVEVPNARADYEVVGLFADRVLPQEPYPSDGRLKLMYFVPNADAVAAITVREVQRETFYLMLPKLDQVPSTPGKWDVFDAWPINAVILPKHVSLSNLGVLVRLKDDVLGGLYSPVLLYTAKEPPPQVQQYTLQFVSHRGVQGLTCKVETERGATQQCGLANGTKTLEESVPAEIMVKAQGLPPGRVTIRLQGRYANTTSEQLAAEVHFVHQTYPR